MKIQALLFVLMLAAGSLFSAGAGTLEENEARLESSANWGVDLTSGRIAADPSLVLYAEETSRTIVTLPNHRNEAAATLGATVRQDGSFEFPDGTVVFPILAEAVIRVGNEPAGLLEESGLPIVDIESVRLIPVVSTAQSVTQAQEKAQAGETAGPWIGEQRRRSWRKCSGCTKCPQGCIGLSFYQGNNYRSCNFSWPWDRCTETYDFRCRRTDFNCRNCTGAIVGQSATVDWSCGAC